MIGLQGILSKLQIQKQNQYIWCCNNFDIIAKDVAVYFFQLCDLFIIMLLDNLSEAERLLWFV